MEKQVVVAGWGQVTQSKDQGDEIVGPLDLMWEASRKAAETIGSKQALEAVDGVMVVRVLSHHYESAAHLLADKIQAFPRLKIVSGIGGNAPQSLVNRAAGMIARGELDSVLIAGAETYYPRNPKDAVGENALFSGLSSELDRDDMIGATVIEKRHGISLPIQGFPLFENALWADSGLPLDDYLNEIGRLWSGFSQVASNHPYAWHRLPLSAAEIVTPSATNRRITFPYTKRMNSMISVDMGAAIILMTEQKARRFQGKQGNTVYFRAGAYAQDRQRFMIEKSNFTASPPHEVSRYNRLKKKRSDHR